MQDYIGSNLFGWQKIQDINLTSAFIISQHLIKLALIITIRCASFSFPPLDEDNRTYIPTTPQDAIFNNASCDVGGGWTAGKTL